jgi:hypothetical protein
MIKVFNEYYYLDLDKLEEYLSIPPREDDQENAENQFSAIKYEIVKLMIEVVFSENKDLDEKLGINNQGELSLPFKMAFNTLLNYKILTIL